MFISGRSNSAPSVSASGLSMFHHHVKLQLLFEHRAVVVLMKSAAARLSALHAECWSADLHECYLFKAELILNCHAPIIPSPAFLFNPIIPLSLSLSLTLPGPPGGEQKSPRRPLQHEPNVSLSSLVERQTDEIITAAIFVVWPPAQTASEGLWRWSEERRRIY